MSDPVYQTTRSVVAAALRTEAGTVFSLPMPARHHDVIHHMLMVGMTRDEVAQSDQGFVLNDGTWARRKPALRIAEEAGQLIHGTAAHPHHGLFSEDVW